MLRHLNINEKGLVVEKSQTQLVEVSPEDVKEFNTIFVGRIHASIYAIMSRKRPEQPVGLHHDELWGDHQNVLESGTRGTTNYLPTTQVLPNVMSASSPTTCS